MNKKKILDNLSSIGKINEIISPQSADVIITMFYMNMLVGAGFIEMDKNKLTVKGFDTSMDLIEAGWKVTKEEVLLSIKSLMKDGEDDDIISDLIIECQEIGLDGINEKLKANK